jgi:hypothetical protein
MSADFRLLMISAMYENGGNMTQRTLDGHPNLNVYPFESQLGTRHVVDALTSVFPVKYRWPVFELDATPLEDYQAIIDEEAKVRARTPDVSKFRHWQFDFSDTERRDIYLQIVGESGRTRAANVAAFFRATFFAWKDHRSSGREEVYVGYSPIVVVDADKILNEMPNSHVLHVVRNPWSAYADTKKRPVPLSLHQYMLGWTLNQYHALLYATHYPGRIHIVRAEDVMAGPEGALREVCQAIGVDTDPSLRSPSWNRMALDEIYPWGTIRHPTPEANRMAALELSPEERDEIRTHAWQYLDVFDYSDPVSWQ